MNQLLPSYHVTHSSIKSTQMPFPHGRASALTLYFNNIYISEADTSRIIVRCLFTKNFLRFLVAHSAHVQVKLVNNQSLLQRTGSWCTFIERTDKYSGRLPDLSTSPHAVIWYGQVNHYKLNKPQEDCGNNTMKHGGDAVVATLQQLFSSCWKGLSSYLCSNVIK